KSAKVFLMFIPINSHLEVCMSAPIIASLDLGSNTFLMMLAKKNGQGWADKQVFQHLPRISEHLKSGGHFTPEALNRAWQALDDFALKIKHHGPVAKVMAKATMAVRMAANGPDFISEINRRYGWEADVISGEEEARLTAVGALAALHPLPPESLIFDIGGRSTEFIQTLGQKPKLPSQSLSLGVVGLTEEYLSAPALAPELERLQLATRTILAQGQLPKLPLGAPLIGTAGTVTTMAAMLMNLTTYQPELINNARLTRQAISTLLSEVSQLDIATRIKTYHLHPRRADAIVAGLALILEIMSYYQCENMVVSANGLLEGIWLLAADNV
ncbi:MAG: hypothetical protein ACRCTY_09815, partial [Candidatus Adiutrix sp.]